MEIRIRDSLKNLPKDKRVQTAALLFSAGSTMAFTPAESICGGLIVGGGLVIGLALYVDRQVRKDNKWHSEHQFETQPLMYQEPEKEFDPTLYDPEGFANRFIQYQRFDRQLDIERLWLAFRDVELQRPESPYNRHNLIKLSGHERWYEYFVGFCRQYKGSYPEYVRRSLDERLSALEAIVQQHGVDIRGVQSEVQYAKNLAMIARKEARVVGKDLNGFDQRIDALEQFIGNP